jgi:hypothetical protein
MIQNTELNTMLSIFALCVRSPHRTKTLTEVVSRYNSLSTIELPNDLAFLSADIPNEGYAKVYTATKNGFQKTSLIFEDTKEMQRLIRAVREEGIEIELDPEAYVFLADQCLGQRGGLPAVNL